MTSWRQCFYATSPSLHTPPCLTCCNKNVHSFFFNAWGSCDLRAVWSPHAGMPCNCWRCRSYILYTGIICWQSLEVLTTPGVVLEMCFGGWRVCARVPSSRRSAGPLYCVVYCAPGRCSVCTRLVIVKNWNTSSDVTRRWCHHTFLLMRRCLARSGKQWRQLWVETQLGPKHMKRADYLDCHVYSAFCFFLGLFCINIALILHIDFKEKRKWHCIDSVLRPIISDQDKRKAN